MPRQKASRPRCACFVITMATQPSLLWLGLVAVVTTLASNDNIITLSTTTTVTLINSSGLFIGPDPIFVLAFHVNLTKNNKIFGQKADRQ